MLCCRDSGFYYITLTGTDVFVLAVGVLVRLKPSTISSAVVGSLYHHSDCLECVLHMSMLQGLVRDLGRIYTQTLEPPLPRPSPFWNVPLTSWWLLPLVAPAKLRVKLQKPETQLLLVASCTFLLPVQFFLLLLTLQNLLVFWPKFVVICKRFG